jgi:hypothetical protein
MVGATWPVEELHDQSEAPNRSSPRRANDMINARSIVILSTAERHELLDASNTVEIAAIGEDGQPNLAARAQSLQHTPRVGPSSVEC